MVLSKKKNTKKKKQFACFPKIWVGFSQTPITGYIHRPYSQDGRPFASDISPRIGSSNVVLLCCRVASYRKMRESDKSLSFHCFLTDQQLERKNLQGHQPHFIIKQHIRKPFSSWWTTANISICAIGQVH